MLSKKSPEIRQIAKPKYLQPNAFKIRQISGIWRYIRQYGNPDAPSLLFSPLRETKYVVYKGASRHRANCVR